MRVLLTSARTMNQNILLKAISTTLINTMILKIQTHPIKRRTMDLMLLHSKIQQEKRSLSSLKTKQLSSPISISTTTINTLRKKNNMSKKKNYLSLSFKPQYSSRNNNIIKTSLSNSSTILPIKKLLHLQPSIRPWVSET